MAHETAATHLAYREKVLVISSGQLLASSAQVEVSSLDDAMRGLARGNAQRVVGAMKMNARSSRGHAPHDE